MTKRIKNRPKMKDAYIFNTPDRYTVYVNKQIETFFTKDELSKFLQFPFKTERLNMIKSKQLTYKYLNQTNNDCIVSFNKMCNV